MDDNSERPYRSRSVALPKLEDIADQVGVSVSTVSRALAGKGRVSSETLHKIKEAAESLAYPLRANRESHLHSSFAQSSMKNLAVVVWGGGGVDAFFSQTILSLSEQCRERDISFQLIRAPDEQSLEGVVKGVKSDVALLFTWNSLDGDAGRALEKCPCPVILINRHIKGIGNTCAVTLDDFAAGLRAVEYLYELGHRRIAYISGDPARSSIRERAAGFRAGLESLGCLDPSLFWRQTVRKSDSALLNAMHSFLDRKNPPTAIVAWEDGIATAVRVTLEYIGKRVPEDVSIVGFNNSWGQLDQVALTSFDYRFYDLASHAVLLADCLVQGRIHPPVRWCVIPRLVIGETTGPAPRDG